MTWVPPNAAARLTRVAARFTIIAMADCKITMRLMTICTLAMSVVTAIASSGQTVIPKSTSPPAAASQKVPKTKVTAKAQDLNLINLGPINPEALAKTMKPAAESISTETKPSASSLDSGVMEFHAVTEAPTTYTAPGLVSKDSKQSLLKNVHGEASGALASGADGAAHAANAAVGASSKSGKIHIFIETEHNQDSAPH